MADFVLVLGADADARFRETEQLVVQQFPTSVGPAKIAYCTRWADEGYEAKVPREMWIDARGSTTAPFLDVINAYGRASTTFLASIAVSANAYVGDAEPKIAFDATPTGRDREYFTSFVREEVGTLPRPGRNVDVDATLALIQVLAEHPEPDRLRRAVARYARALTHWRPGHETMALAHLFVGMETLAPFALQRERERSGFDDDDLARSWGIDERRSHLRQVKLLAHVRRAILFHGDDDAASKAKKASDGFEHGFLDFAVVQDLAADAMDRTARYLRHAIFEFCGLDADVTHRLEAPPYDTPLRSYLHRYVWGRFLGEAEDMAAADQEYPILTWRSKLAAFALQDDGFYDITPEETFTVRCNDALRFQRERLEVWGPKGVESKPFLEQEES